MHDFAVDDRGSRATLDSALRLFVGQAPGTPASLPHADVLIACILHSSDSAAALSNVFAALIDQVSLNTFQSTNKAQPSGSMFQVPPACVAPVPTFPLLLQVPQDPEAALSRMQILLNKAVEVAGATSPPTAGFGKLGEWQSPGMDDVAYKLVTLGTSGGNDDTDMHVGKVTLSNMFESHA
jgi:hypothetical protein